MSRSLRATSPRLVSDLAVSIISYRTPDLLRQCLEALHRDTQAGELTIEVTVVDNASGDGSPELVEREFPWVRLIRNPRNVGFGAAHNQALLGATARHLMVLNSDARLAPHALARLVGYLDAHPDVAIVGPRLRRTNGDVQQSRRRFPTAATLFLESTQLQRLSPRNAVLRRFYIADRSDTEEQDVDWLSGACLCIRTSVARQVGLFDERYFMYSEEVDLCRRYKAKGWRVAYLPDAEVIHVESASADQDLVARDRMFQTSKLRYAERWHGRGVALSLRLYLAVDYALRWVEESVKLVGGSRVAERRQRLRVIRAGLRHVLLG